MANGCRRKDDNCQLFRFPSNFLKLTYIALLLCFPPIDCTIFVRYFSRKNLAKMLGSMGFEKLTLTFDEDSEY